MPIRKITVARNDDVYECFPCLVRTNSGRLITIYRESEAHSCAEYSHIVMRHSLDEGETWSDRQVLIESCKADGVLRKYNCPRISQLRDGRLVAVCDAYNTPPGESLGARDAINVLWFSDDDGATWSEPVETPVTGIVPDKLIETASGAWLLAVHVGPRDVNTEEQYLHQRVFRSIDRGASWEGPISVAYRDGLNLCEGGIVQLPDATLVCYMRENSNLGWVGYKSLSTDGGKSWEGPYPTLMPGCHRPVPGLLPSGDVMVTFRHQLGGTGPFARNFFAYRESVASAVATEPAEQGGIILPLDHDRAERSDSSYSGWCVLGDGSLFAVTYIKDDAPMAQIRGYFFGEADF